MEKTEKVTVKIPKEYAKLFDKNWRHAVLEGGRYSLKSHTVARYCLLRARAEKIRVACLRQFQKNIGDSSYQLLIDLIKQYGFTEFTWTNDRIINTKTGSEFIFKGLDRNIETTIKSIEGVDLAWIDEAQTITKKSIRILTPTIRKRGSQIIWTMNRLTDFDAVINYFIKDPPRKDVWHLMTDYRIALKNGWLSDEILYEIEQSRIHHPEDYAHDYLGKAISNTDRAIINTNEVVKAMHREDVSDEGAVEIGVDVARLGTDRSVFVKRKGLKTLDIALYQKKRLPDLCDLLENFAGNSKDILIKIDDTGVGGGVTDEMLKRGYNILAVNFGSRSTDPDKYPNKISEMWFYLASIIEQIKIINDKDLLRELTTRQWQMDNKGRRGVESKEQYKKRGYRSPDLADALILAFYNQPPKPKVSYGGVR